MKNRFSESGDKDEEEWEGADDQATGGYADDDDFDYEEYVEREFPENAGGRSGANWKQWIWRAVIVVVCLLLIWRFMLY